MATMQIETLANEFVEIIAQQVSRELEERLPHSKLDDLQAEVQDLRDCNAANLQVMRSQQEKINHLETILARIEVTSVIPKMVDYMIQQHVDDRIKNFLGQHEYVNTADLIDFLNDRVRITVE